MPTLAIYAIIAVVALGALGGITYKVHHAGYESGIAECERQAKDQRDKEAKQGAGASTKLESGNAKAKIVYRTITQQVDRYIDRPIYRGECFDADGLRDSNAALLGTLAPPGKPDAAVPAPDAPKRWLGGLRAPKTD